MKTYTFELIIKEGSDEFWDEITSNGKIGCEEILEEIKDKLGSFFPDEFKIKIIKFEDK